MPIRPATRTALAAALLLALAACGGNDGDAPAGDGELAAGVDEEMGVPLDELVGDEDGALDCPPDVRKDLTGPDMTGVQLGMSLDEALATVRCNLGEDAAVTTENRWLDNLDTYGAELDVQLFTVKKGEHRPCDFAREWQECEGGEKWGHVDEIVSVGTPGAPGQETAWVVWRTQNFPAGRMPAVQVVLDALVAKYGPPQRSEAVDERRGYSAGRRDLQWVLDPNGQPMSEANPLFHRCVGGVYAESGSTRVSWTRGCGLNISARVMLAGDNPGLAMELHTAMVDQTALFDHVEAMKQALAQAGQARRDAEVQAGSEAADVRL